MPRHQPQSVQIMLQQIGEFVSSSLSLASQALVSATTSISTRPTNEQRHKSDVVDAVGIQLRQLFDRGYCAWPACDTMCNSDTAFLQHMIAAHVLTNKRTATEIKLQAEIIEQLLSRLTKECQKLEAMKVHLAWNTNFDSSDNCFSPNASLSSSGSPFNDAKQQPASAAETLHCEQYFSSIHQHKPLSNLAEPCHRVKRLKCGQYCEGSSKTAVLKPKRGRPAKIKQTSPHKKSAAQHSKSYSPKCCVTTTGTSTQQEPVSSPNWLSKQNNATADYTFLSGAVHFGEKPTTSHSSPCTPLAFSVNSVQSRSQTAIEQLQTFGARYCNSLHSVSEEPRVISANNDTVEQQTNDLLNARRSVITTAAKCRQQKYL